MPGRDFLVVKRRDAGTTVHVACVEDDVGGGARFARAMQAAHVRLEGTYPLMEFSILYSRPKAGDDIQNYRASEFLGD